MVWLVYFFFQLKIEFSPSTADEPPRGAGTLAPRGLPLAHHRMDQNETEKSLAIQVSGMGARAHQYAGHSGMYFLTPFLPTVPTFAVRDTHVSRTANVGTVSMNGLIVEIEPFDL